MSTRSSSDDPQLRQLLEQCVLAWQEQGPAAVDALLAEKSGQAAIVRASLQALARAGLLENEAGPADLPGSIGGYRVHRVLGRGGMGTVFLAEDPAVRRLVAIKVVHPQLLWSGRARQRFEREIRMLAQLHHRGTVPVHHFGDDQGVPYYVMEYVSGASLADMLAAVAGRAPEALTASDLTAAWRSSFEPGQDANQPPFVAPDAPWWRGVVDLIAQVADALQHAHQHGIVHRDVKPSNILVEADGTARLLDFGLARAEGDPELTKSGTTLGSEPYMAPEQFDGSGQVDGRTDVFSLGATLYEALVLQPPFGTGGPQTRDRIRAGDHAPLRRLVASLPRDLAAVCAQALDPEPRQRYASASALAADLRAVLAGLPVVARPIGPVRRALRAARQHPVTAAALALAAALIVAVPLVLNWQQRQSLRQIGEALQRAEHSRDQALEAVDRMLVAVAQERLFRLPEADAVRRQLLEDARDLQEAMLANWPDDERVRREHTRTKVRLARIRRLLGDHGEAERLNAEALAALRAQQPPDAIELSAVLAEQARYAARRSDLAGAAVKLAEAVECTRASAETAIGRNAEILLRRTAELLVEQAIVAGMAGDERAAAAALDGSMELLLRLPEDPNTARLIGRSLANALKSAAMRQEFATAVTLATAATDSYERALAVAPDDWELAAAAANVAVDHAHIVFLQQQPALATELAEAAHERLAVVNGQHPNVGWLRFSLHNAKLVLADCLAAVGRRNEAMARLDEAVDGFRRLVAADANQENRHKLAVAIGSRAALLEPGPAADALFAEAQQLLDGLLAENPASSSFWQQCFVTRMHRAAIHRAAGNPAVEAALLDEAVELARPHAAATAPLRRAARPLLGRALLHRADCAAHTGEAEAALEYVREAVDACGMRAADAAGMPALQALLQDSAFVELLR